MPNLYSTDPSHIRRTLQAMPGVAWMAHSFWNATTGEVWPLNVTSPLDDGVARHARHGYYASVSWLDFQIGSARQLEPNPRLRVSWIPTRYRASAGAQPEAGWRALRPCARTFLKWTRPS